MKVTFRRGTEAEWDRYNPTLRDREIGLVLETGRFKVGDGKSAWADLDWSSTLPVEMVIGYEPPPHKPDWTDSVRVKFARWFAS